MFKLKANTAVIIIILCHNSLAFGWTDNYLSFGIASGGAQYTISNFNKGNAHCYSYTNGSNDKQLNAKGHIMCNVPYSALGTFTLTVADSNGESCTILSTQNPTQIAASKNASLTSHNKIRNKTASEKKEVPEDSGPYIFTSNCTLPGVVVALTPHSYNQFHYGDWQVNLQ